MQEIKELRKELGLSQNQFAWYFGIPVSTIHNWEQGIAKPPRYVPRMIKKLAVYEKDQIEKFVQNGGEWE